MVQPPGGSYQGGAGGAAGPSTATAATYGSGQDGSGWIVNFSGMQSANVAQDKSGGGVPGVTGTGAVFGSSSQALLIAAAVGLVGLLAWRFKN